MSYRQVELKSEDTYLVCWVNDDPRLKAGANITLKEIPETVWTIRRIYNAQPEHQRRTWRVGGVMDR